MTPKNIRKLRKEFGLTQMQFAKTIGVTFATVNRWECGHCSPLPDRLATLKVINGISRDVAIGIMPRLPPDQIMKKWSQILKQEMAKTGTHPEKRLDESSPGLWVVQDKQGWQHLTYGKPKKLGTKWVSSTDGVPTMYVPKGEEIEGLKADEPVGVSLTLGY